MTETFKEKMQQFLTDNIDYLVEKFIRDICKDPDYLDGFWIHLIYSSLDIENLDIKNLKFKYDTESELKYISLFEIQTDDVLYQYDAFTDNKEFLTSEEQEVLKNKYYRKALKIVLNMEIETL